MKLLLFLASLPLIAQTAVKPDQIRAAPASAVRLLAFDATGRLTLLELGAGVQLTGNTLVAIATQTPALATARLSRDASGNYSSTVGIVVRNGVIQERGADYSIVAGALVPSSPWSAEDTVLAITAERGSGTVTRVVP